MNTAEIYELILMQRSSIDTQFQVWITITFATIVASFTSKEELRTKYKIFVSLLYIIATVTLASRWYYDAIETISLIEALDKEQIELWVPKVTIISRSLLMILGSIGTLIFIFSSHKKLVRQDA